MSSLGQLPKQNKRGGDHTSNSKTKTNAVHRTIARISNDYMNGRFEKAFSPGDIRHLVLRGLAKDVKMCTAAERPYFAAAMESAERTPMTLRGQRWALLGEHQITYESGRLRWVGQPIKIAERHRRQRIFVDMLQRLGKVSNFDMLAEPSVDKSTTGGKVPISPAEVDQAQTDVRLARLLAFKARDIFDHRSQGPGKARWREMKDMRESRVVNVPVKKKLNMVDMESVPYLSPPVPNQDYEMLDYFQHYRENKPIKLDGKIKNLLREPDELVVHLFTTLPKNVWEFDRWAFTVDHVFPRGYVRREWMKLNHLEAEAEVFDNLKDLYDLEEERIDQGDVLSESYWAIRENLERAPWMCVIAKSDNHSRKFIRMLLIRGNVEQNPGPRITRDNSDDWGVFEPRFEPEEFGVAYDPVVGFGEDLDHWAVGGPTLVDEFKPEVVARVCKTYADSCVETNLTYPIEVVRHTIVNELKTDTTEGSISWVESRDQILRTSDVEEYFRNYDASQMVKVVEVGFGGAVMNSLANGLRNLLDVSNPLTYGRRELNAREIQRFTRKICAEKGLQSLLLMEELFRTLIEQEGESLLSFIPKFVTCENEKSTQVIFTDGFHRRPIFDTITKQAVTLIDRDLCDKDRDKTAVAPGVLDWWMMKIQRTTKHEPTAFFTVVFEKFREDHTRTEDVRPHTMRSIAKACNPDFQNAIIKRWVLRERPNPLIFGRLLDAHFDYTESKITFSRSLLFGNYVPPKSMKNSDRMSAETQTIARAANDVTVNLSVTEQGFRTINNVLYRAISVLSLRHQADALNVNLTQ